MRIRKNAKLSPLLFFSHASAAPEIMQTHVCQLNQSPWDVIPFAPQASNSNNNHHSNNNNQMEGEDSFTGNGSLGDSMGAVESSVASMMEISEEKCCLLSIKPEDNVAAMGEEEEINANGCGGSVAEAVEMKKHPIIGGESESNMNDNEKREEWKSCGSVISHCQKNDGKGWQCKKEAREGHAFCDHHLTLLRSYNNTTSSTPPSKKPQTQTQTRRTRGSTGAARPPHKKAGSGSSSANPYEFYYYSGFGPLWGRKRGDRGGGNNNIGSKTVGNDVVHAAHTTMHRSSSSSSSLGDGDCDEFDYDYDDYDYDDDDVRSGGDSGKKRMRKPVKARSLKSLM